MRSRTILWSTVISLALILSASSSVSASLVTIESDGEVVVNVLGDETTKPDIPRSESLTVTNALSYAPNTNSQVSLVKEDGEVKLKLSGDSGNDSLTVSDYTDQLIEIKERPETATLSIKVKDGKFLIEQNGLVATTDYEITVDPENARLLLAAPSGEQYLSIYPHEATQTLLRANTLSNYSYDDGVTIEESDSHDLIYKVSGERLLNFFDFYYYPVPVTASVSALTGEITSVDEPQWLKVVGFLFAY